MCTERRSLGETLKYGLALLENRTVGDCALQPFSFFEQSPLCPNYGTGNQLDLCPCRKCILISLVPALFREKHRPCRYIPLNLDGETLESLSHSTDGVETMQLLRDWLRTIVIQLEHEGPALADAKTATFRFAPQDTVAQSLFRTAYPKCANTACPVVFHWRRGGRFFRFAVASDEAAPDATLPKVRHYWLCAQCSQIYTLIFEASRGVLVRLGSHNTQRAPNA